MMDNWSLSRERPQPQDRNSNIFDHSRDRYLIICLGGLQPFIKKLVDRHVETCGWKVDVQIIPEVQQGADTHVKGVHNGQAGCGKLLVTTDAPPAVLNGIRCVQAVYALVAYAVSLDIVIHEALGADDALPSDSPGSAGSRENTGAALESQPRSEIALTRLESLVYESTMWPAAIDVWRRFRTAKATATVTDSDGSAVGRPGPTRIEQRYGASKNIHPGVMNLKYRVSVIRDGKHPFRSLEASPRLGGAVYDANPTWTVDLTEYDVEVVAFILERSVAVGLFLGNDRAKHSSNGRVPKEDKALEIGKRLSSLRPSTAYLMLKLANPAPGDVVLDCMCGAGTIPFLGAGWFTEVFFLGGEVDASAIDHLKQNRQLSRRLISPPGVTAMGVSSADACAWDAQSLPLQNGTVDAVVVDMPFGVSCGTPRLIGKLYPLALAEMARVLRPGSGRAVLLVAQPYLLGLPEIRRERRKKSNSAAATAKGRRRGVARGQKDSGDASRGQQRPREEQHLDTDSAAGGGRNPDERSGSCAELEGSGGCVSHGEEQTGGDEGFRAQAANIVRGEVVTPNSEKGPRSGSLKSLWRVRERHAVNVGGLISWLVILDRTDEPPPRPCSDRRRRWVGLHGYCKDRKEGLETTG